MDLNFQHHCSSHICLEDISPEIVKTYQAATDNQFVTDKLFEAIARKKIKLASILIEGGAEVNTKLSSGKTPLMAVCDIIVDREQQHKKEKLKVFELSGVKVQFDKVKVQTSSEVVCLPGRIRIEAFCIECPTGTFYNKQSKCEPCHLGMYQELTGQIVCKPCPDGYTTSIKGAQQDDLCTEASGSSKLIIITSSVVVSVVVIIGIIGALLLRQKLR
ncbi:unnamed protein product [Mytilus coruscus]|uniref:Tyrosine-protein kinase ephrin type A/B receptor-like domain-containing protein n=1 Tax=Mytilus coruscus TaxID=42192 RepID=A0A6J7ZT38_MYTCO|nr:unnamed protein product [Mytilus coruscus]